FAASGLRLFSFSFNELGTFRVEARVAARNARGNRAVEKLGAVAEGLLRGSLVVADGSRHDQVLWSCLKEDWRRARAAATEASTWVHWPGAASSASPRRLRSSRSSRSPRSPRA